MDQIRLERIPPVLQTGVHTVYTTDPLWYGKRDSNSQNSDSKSEAFTYFAIPAFVDLSGFEPEQRESKSLMLTHYITNQFRGSSRIRTYSVKNTCFTDKPDSPTSAYFHNLVWEAGLFTRLNFFMCSRMLRISPATSCLQCR